jgi:hypothetical protein
MELGLAELKFRRQALKRRWTRMCAAPHERLVSLLFRRRHAEMLAGGAKFRSLYSMREFRLLRVSGLSGWIGVLAPNQSGGGLGCAGAGGCCRASLRGFVPHPCDSGVILMTVRTLLERMVTKVRLRHLMVLAMVGRMLHWPASRARCVMCGDGTNPNKTVDQI